MTCAITIRDLADRTGVSAHTLRYYERAGLMISVPRDAAGRRLYGESHVRWVRFLRHLREGGMSIAKVRAYAKLTQSSLRDGDHRRLTMLREHRDDVKQKIDRLRQHLEILNQKIARGCAPGDDSRAG